MSLNNSSKYDMGVTHQLDVSPASTLNDIIPPTPTVTQKKKCYSGKCSCGSKKDVWYCQPGTQKREFCGVCKPDNAVPYAPKSNSKPLKKIGYHIMDLPYSSIPHCHIHNILYDKISGRINTTNDPTWSTIFNDKFHEKKATKRYMKKLSSTSPSNSNQFNNSVKEIENLLIAMINNEEVMEKHSIHTIRELAILMREQGLSPQIWHRDELKSANGKFIIYPLSPNYSIYVIPKSHKVDQSKAIHSDSAIKLLLQPGQIFIADSALVHAGGETNKDNTPYILDNTKKCFDIAFHAYVTEGLNVKLPSVSSKSEDTVIVDVTAGNGSKKKENKPSKKLAKGSHINPVALISQKTSGKKRKSGN